MTTPSRRPKECGHLTACTYGQVDFEKRLCQVWWCHKCGALAIRTFGKGRPSKGEWWHVVQSAGQAPREVGRLQVKR